MNIIIYGDQSVMIKNRLKKVVKERLEEKDDMNYVSFDMRYATLDEVIEEASYMPLGYDHKLIVLEDATFLEKKTKGTLINKDIDDKQIKRFINYLKSPIEEVDLVFTINSEKIDTKSEMYKLISEKGMVYELLSVKDKDWPSYIHRYFNETLNTKIDRDAIGELINRIQGNLNIFINEASKLALLTDHVTYEDVVNNVSKPLEENAFDMYSYLIKGETEKALQLFKDLRTMMTEPVVLISLLANQFRLLYQVSFLSKMSYTNDQIAEELKIKAGRVYYIKKDMYAMSLDKILETLNNLYELDYKIKSGQVDRIFAFEMFLINFKTN